MDISKIGFGPGFNLYALVVNKACPVSEYISNLEEKDQKQVFALFNRILEKGIPKNREKFRSIGKKIFELKTRGGIRILSFFGGSSLPRSLVLTHVFHKPHSRILICERKKAVKWRKEYFGLADNNRRLNIKEKKHEY